MKANQKSFTYALIVLIVILLFTVYFAIAFAMRDKGAVWCKMSFGKYKNITDCRSASSREDCSIGEEKLCNGGFFDSKGGRGYMPKDAMKIL